MRFDVYDQDDMVSWRNNVDMLPEFDCDFRKTHIALIEENKPHKDSEGNKIPCYYYPGIHFRIDLVRDPLQKVLNFLFPAWILCYFIAMADQIDELADLMGSVSIALLTFVALIDQVRSSLPPISDFTYMDIIVVMYILLSIIPGANLAHWDEVLTGLPSRIGFGII